MDVDGHIVAHFVVLFTAQKLKKFKTWQDGTMKYYSFNRKLVLTDEKGYHIDKKFNRKGVPDVGDEIEFDGHLVTVESFESQEPYVNEVITRPNGMTTASRPMHPVTAEPSSSSTSSITQHLPQSIASTHESIIPINPSQSITSIQQVASNNSIRKRPIELDPIESMDLDWDFDIDETSLNPVPATKDASSIQTPNQPSNTIRMTATTTTTTTVTNSRPTAPRRLRVGISKRSLSNAPGEHQPIVSNTTNANDNPSSNARPVPLVLQFPTRDKAMAIMKTKKYQKRTRVVPSRIPNVNQYKDVFRKMIHEHLQIMLTNYAVYYFSVQSSIGNQQRDIERLFRHKGIGFYSTTLHSDGRYQESQRFRIRIRNREHHSKYNKDDVWVVSRSSNFEPHGTFLARSTFYGPFSDGMLEVECLSPRDARVASQLVDQSGNVCALRTISSTTEFMMLDHLDEKLDRLPLMPFMLGDGKGKKRKKDKDPLHQNMTNEPDFIRIRREDNVDVEKKIKETIDRYHLNEDQESVLRQVAKSTIIAPGWNDETANPVVLVHDIIDTACLHREPDDLISFRILVSSNTHTIPINYHSPISYLLLFQSLLKLGYDEFVRIGSLKKIAKAILPYTAKAKASGNEEIKELEQMLEDPHNSEEDTDLIASTLQRFRKNENSFQVQYAQVVGTTCVASTFEVFNGATFSLALLDEASQLMEPLSMVPLSRFLCSRLLMIGDPLQLPPTVTTGCDEHNTGEGIDKTLFDRLTECHPSISSISNHLFYGRRLRNGITEADRAPIMAGLPNLAFVEIPGQEQRNPRNQSFWNETEIAITAHITEALSNLGVPASDIGVISLYKEQADRLAAHVGSNAQDRKQHISTVDAFQGGEKDVIILSTVRTTNSAFIDNPPRVNVALTRAKRHLFILGKQGLLMSSNIWSNILTQCQGKKIITLLRYASLSHFHN
ncbi:hypothetical protein K492DRAFT_219779 [Lichtheimia hyalospora FSU 10163]|nr:hypothetical protein K492DRAFT_219779 [Lichtheimia hyalospora FSU 10163]